MPKRLLLIMPEFYGIENKVKSMVEEHGYEATMIDNKLINLDFKCRDSKIKWLRRIYFFLFRPRERYIKRELKKIGSLKFDILFSINCNIACSYLFRELKNENPHLYSVLFLWDSLTLYNWVKELTFFDRVFTFDRHDSEKYNIIYKPNFYLERADYKINSKEFDLCFIGKFSKERLQVLDSILRQNALSDISSCFYLWPAFKKFGHNKILYSIIKKNIFNINWVSDYLLNYEAIEMKLKRDFIKNTRINFNEAQSIVLSSNVVLDMPSEGQNGHTHRTIEALAYGRKLLTTYAGILIDDFYNPEQICVIDRMNPEISSSWIKEKTVFPVDKCFKDLELSNWIKAILNEEVA